MYVGEQTRGVRGEKQFEFSIVINLRVRYVVVLSRGTGIQLAFHRQRGFEYPFYWNNYGVTVALGVLCYNRFR